MLSLHLIRSYETLRALGLTRSKRDFSRRWLGRGRTYLRDYANPDRAWGSVSPTTTAQLRANLSAVAARVPQGLRVELRAILLGLERDAAVARTLAEWGR